jgi:hypothetical protein
LSGISIGTEVLDNAQDSDDGSRSGANRPARGASGAGRYATMSLNERVTVLGVITEGNRRVTGTSILRGDNRQAP